MTEISEKQNKEQERALSAWIAFGMGGHSGEYVLNLENFDINKFIPSEIELDIKEGLGEDWSVENRGSRIEICHRREYGKRDDEKVFSTVENVLTSRGYNLKRL